MSQDAVNLFKLFFQESEGLFFRLSAYLFGYLRSPIAISCYF
jgi:hypothetical protein